MKAIISSSKKKQKKPSQSLPKEQGICLKESQIQSQILDWLSAQNYCHWRNYVGPKIINVGAKKHFIKSPMAGLPDIIGILKNRPGQMFAIEIKNANGKLSDMQELWIRRLESSGVNVIVTRDLSQVIEVLAKAEGIL